VRGTDGNPFVPHVSVTVGVLLAVASLGVLIYFIHHVSVSIQAAQIIAAVSVDLHEAIDWLFPEDLGDEPPHSKEGGERPIGHDFDGDSKPVLSGGSGYLQALDNDRLMSVATNGDLCIHLSYRPGHFIRRDDEIVKVIPGTRVNDGLAREINGSFVLGAERTPTQDVEFAVNQLVEIALRALSPGINDPFTAITCIDRLGAALCHLARRQIPSPYRYDESAKLRVIAIPVTFTGVTDAAFNQIRQAGRTNAAVSIRLLETIGVIAARARREADLATLQSHAEMIWRGSQDALPEPRDQQDVEARYQDVQRVFIKKNHVSTAFHNPKKMFSP
jgi:uncharacterized membrane protein